MFRFLGHFVENMLIIIDGTTWQMLVWYADERWWFGIICKVCHLPFPVEFSSIQCCGKCETITTFWWVNYVCFRCYVEHFKCCFDSLFFNQWETWWKVLLFDFCLIFGFTAHSSLAIANYGNHSNNWNMIASNRIAAFSQHLNHHHEIKTTR